MRLIPAKAHDLTVSVFIATSTFCLIFLTSIPLASAQTHVGVASTVVDLGTLERESENIATFYLVSSSSNSFLVNLNKEPANSDFFSSKGYNDELLNYSEENVMDWIEFFNDYVEVESLSEKRDGIGAQREVNFIVNVHEDAEPGYHIFRIKPLPVFSQEAIGQVGARVISVTSVNFVFNVEGDAFRDGIILDVTSKGVSGNLLVTDTHFQNTGTTTITALAKQKIYKDGNFLVESRSGKEKVKPGEVKVLKTPFQSNIFSEGEYEVYTTVDFLTKSISKNSTIYLAPVVPTTAIEVEEEPEIVKRFLWIVIILIIIVAIAILVYKW